MNPTLRSLRLSRTIAVFIGLMIPVLGFQNCSKLGAGENTPPTSPGAAGSLPATALSHGSELTAAMVGPGALGVPISQLRQLSVGGERLGTWPTDGLPSFIPNAPYVYNNDPGNHGGIVPAGGMTIDGFFIPEGVWVSQFNDFEGEQFLINGDNDGTSPAMPGILFRGDRWRGAMPAPGFLNVYANSHVHLWVFYCDAGGLGPADSQANDVAFKVADFTSNDVYFRNYVSYTTTGIQPSTYAPQIIENFVEKITYFHGPSGGSHLNGIEFGDGESNVLMLRNKILLQSPDEAGHVVDQTDAIGFIQNPTPGGYAGSGVNLDGSIGFMVKDNYVGGGGYTIYAGLNAGLAATSVQNMQMIGNQISTQWWPNGGSYGPCAAQPLWGSYGNMKSNNTWADGAKKGQLAF